MTSVKLSFEFVHLSLASLAIEVFIRTLKLFAFHIPTANELINYLTSLTRYTSAEKVSCYVHLCGKMLHNN